VKRSLSANVTGGREGNVNHCRHPTPLISLRELVLEVVDARHKVRETDLVDPAPGLVETHKGVCPVAVGAAADLHERLVAAHVRYEQDGFLADEPVVGLLEPASGLVVSAGERARERGGPRAIAFGVGESGSRTLAWRLRSITSA
jgi:hypothetical protein